MEKKVKIVKAPEGPRSELVWYANRVGETFVVSCEDAEAYFVYTGTVDLEREQELIGRVPKTAVERVMRNLSYHPEAAEGEVFVGNTHRVTDFPLPELKGLKTIRMGQKAYDVYGELLDENQMKPVFIDRSEFDQYNRIMTELSKK